MNPENTVKLNIGAGKTHLPGFTNIDISERAEISMDIGTQPLPFADSSVDVVFSHHTLEHVPNYLFALSEIHRVLKHGGYLFLGVPYITLTKYNLVNPYHLHHFNEHSFDFFDPEKLKGSAVEPNEIYFSKGWHRLHYMGRFGRLPGPVRRWCKDHLFNVVKKIDFAVMAIKPGQAKPAHKPEQALEQEFDQYLNGRVRYPKSG